MVATWYSGDRQGEVGSVKSRPVEDAETNAAADSDSNPANTEQTDWDRIPEWINFRTVVSVILISFTYGLERMSFHSFLIVSKEMFPCFRLGLRIFHVLAALLPLVGAWLGENVIGEFKSLLLGLVLELAAACIFTVWLPIARTTELPVFTDEHEGAFVTALVLMGTGIGLTRSNVFILAARQIPESRIREANLFLWFYWILNLGELLGICMQGTYNANILIIMWAIPLLLALVFVVIARIVNPHFRQDNPSSRISKIALDCLLNRSVADPRERAGRGEHRRLLDDGVECHHLQILGKHLKSLFMLVALQSVFAAIYDVEIRWATDIKTDWNRTKEELGHDFHWIVNGLDPLISVLVTPVTYFALMPCLKRYWSTRITQLRLMGIGMVLCAVSCLAVAILDYIRKDTTDFPYTGMFYLIPPFVILELAEISTFVVSSEFFYLETPTGLKNFVFGLSLSSHAVALGLIYLLDHLLPSPVITGTLSVVLACLAAVQLLVLTPFVTFAKSYKYRKDYDNVDFDRMLKRRPDFGGD